MSLSDTLPDLPLFPLPPLPPITDADLGRLALTHSSSHSSPRRATAVDSEEIQDYEKLEHVGDGILGSIATTLLHDLFPHLQPGPATQLKGYLVCNSTLAQLCSRYHIHDRIIAAPSALYTTRVQIKTRASVFEAYIAAVFYDFLTTETPGAYDWETSSDDTVSATGATADEGSVRDDITEVTESVAGESAPSDTTVDEVTRASSALDVSSDDGGFHDHVNCAAPSRSSSTVSATAYPDLPPLSMLRPVAMRTRGEAYDYVEHWLRPLFTPIAHFGMDLLRRDALMMKQDKADSDYVAGAAGCLNSWAQKETGVLPKYEAEHEGLRWRVTARVSDANGKEYVAEAIRDSKKAGMAFTAWTLCKEIGLDIGEK